MAHDISSRARQMPDATRVFAIVAAIFVQLGVFVALTLPPRVKAPAPDLDDFRIPFIVVHRPLTADPLPPRWRQPVSIAMPLPLPLPVGDPIPMPDPMPAPIPSQSTLEPIATPAPAYPAAALRDHITGTVLLDLLVGTDGRMLKVRVVRSSGHRLLDEAATRQALRYWRFRPAMRNGRAVQAVGRVPVIFSLDR